MNRKVEYHARRLVKAWKHFPTISYTLSDGRIRDDRVQWRAATMEDAPEIYRVIKAGKSDVLSHDFGPVPSVLCDDKAVVEVAKREVGNYEALQLERELDVAEFLALMQDNAEELALLEFTFA